MSDITIKWDGTAIARVSKKLDKALWQTAEWLMGDVRSEQTIPRKTGILQGEAMHVVSTVAGADIVQSTPYARRLYYHPEYNFSKEVNPNAGALWWKPYLEGAKRAEVRRQFLKACRRVGLDVSP